VTDAVGLEPTAVLVDEQSLATAAAWVRQREAAPGLRSQRQGAAAAWREPLLSTISMSDAPDKEFDILHSTKLQSHILMNEPLRRRYLSNGRICDVTLVGQNLHHACGC
jgi:hypothetical protein